MDSPPSPYQSFLVDSGLDNTMPNLTGEEVDEFFPPNDLYANNNRIMLYDGQTPQNNIIIENQNSESNGHMNSSQPYVDIAYGLNAILSPEDSIIANSPQSRISSVDYQYGDLGNGNDQFTQGFAYDSVAHNHEIILNDTTEGRVPTNEVYEGMEVSGDLYDYMHSGIPLEEWTPLSPAESEEIDTNTINMMDFSEMDCDYNRNTNDSFEQVPDYSFEHQYRTLVVDENNGQADVQQQEQINDLEEQVVPLDLRSSSINIQQYSYQGRVLIIPFLMEQFEKADCVKSFAHLSHPGRIFFHVLPNKRQVLADRWAVCKRRPVPSSVPNFEKNFRSDNIKSARDIFGGNHYYEILSL